MTFFIILLVILFLGPLIIMYSFEITSFMTHKVIKKFEKKNIGLIRQLNQGEENKREEIARKRNETIDKILK